VPAGVSGHVPARAGAGVRREAGTLRASSIRPVTAPTVVILAAGQGTRMRSRTPKVLHDLCGQPMIAWPVAAALAAGAGKVVVVDGPDRPLEGKLPDGVELAIQSDPNGTGGAVQAAADALPREGTVLVLAGDAPLVDGPTLQALVDAHTSSGAAATLLSAEHPEPRGYGRIVRDADGHVACIVETKAEGDATPEELAIAEVNASVYAFDAAALHDALGRLGTDNAQGELYLTDTVSILRGDGRSVGAHIAEDWQVVLGVNDRVALAEVRALLQRRILETHMLSGVTVIDPSTTCVDAGVEIGRDAVLEPMTVLRGATRIGAGSRVGPSTTLIDARLGEGVTILNAHVVDAELHDGVTVGPFAYLRPGTVLRAGSKAGTFVELKNSDIGEGTKVPHLSYLGDADVGPGTNIGAANVTANYDGVRKHRTRIGSGVKTAVDTTFVAPVEVGDNAWTGAGAVVRQDVPEGALAVGVPARLIEGYDARRRDQVVSSED
jgi:bifunctional UDP-N-acetylglucosamine pyrophosphorylase / glucosamine-1-phosphate N-acetyltransferase